MHAATVAAHVFIRLAALRPDLCAAYTMLCKGAGFEVRQARTTTSIATSASRMTFAVRRQHHAGAALQGHGLGQHLAAARHVVPRRRSGGTVTLQFFDGSATESPLFLVPPVTANQYYQVIIVKKTTTPAGARRQHRSVRSALRSQRAVGDATRRTERHASACLPSGGGAIKISSIAPAADPRANTLNADRSNLQQLSGRQTRGTTSPSRCARCRTTAPSAPGTTRRSPNTVAPTTPALTSMPPARHTC